MKTVVMIPYWQEYRFPDQSLSDRDTLKIAGHSLIERTVGLLQKIDDVDEIVIYSSNEHVKELLSNDHKYTFHKRDADLDNDNVSIEDIIERFLMKSDADIIVLVHPKCPFLKAVTIADCINKVSSKEFNSSFIGTRHKKLAWFDGNPLNYSLEIGIDTDSLASLEPVILESSAVYVFTKELFKKNRRRLDENPYMKIVGNFEGFEIDRVEDFEIAELIVNAGLDVL